MSEAPTAAQAALPPGAVVEPSGLYDLLNNPIPRPGSIINAANGNTVILSPPGEPVTPSPSGDSHYAQLEADVLIQTLNITPTPAVAYNRLVETFGRVEVLKRLKAVQPAVDWAKWFGLLIGFIGTGEVMYVHRDHLISGFSYICEW